MNYRHLDLPACRAGLTLAAYLERLLLMTTSLACVVSVTHAAAFTRIISGPIVEDLERSITCAWVDYDTDGLLDMFVTNVRDDDNGSVVPTQNSLYRNLGDGAFQKINNALTSEVAFSLSVSWCDYDRDGDPDLFIGHSGQNDSLWRNDSGGVFTRMEDSLPSNDGADTGGSSSWVDYNGDGCMDLFAATVSNQNDLLYQNLCDGNFQLIGPNGAGDLPLTGVSTRLAAWADYNNDGAPDVILGYLDPERNCLLRNDGQGLFGEITVPNLSGSPRGSGFAWGDYDNDGWLDLFVPNGNWLPNALFRNLKGQGFENVASAAGLDEMLTAVKAAWGDYDNDGHLDLVVINALGNNNRLYHNNGDGTFSRDTDSPVDKDGGRSALAVWGDYDNDGDLDLYVVNGDGSNNDPNFLYRNDGNANHWLKVRLQGSPSNRDGIGAKVRVTAVVDGEEITQTREIAPAGSKSMSDQLIAHFGLGDATQVKAVRVDWPSGITQMSLACDVDQLLEVPELSFDEIPQLEVAQTGPQTIRLAVTSDLAPWDESGTYHIVWASTNLTDWEATAGLSAGEWRDLEMNDSAQTFYRLAGFEGL